MQRIILLLLCFLLCACEQIAVLSTPPKKPVISRTTLAKKAKQTFWVNLHEGNYDQLPTTIKLLTAAYLQNSNDPQLAGFLGFSHIWKLTERNREKVIPATITNEIILSKKFFKDAVNLYPTDARLQGFYSVSMLAEGDIFHDEREKVRGYFSLLRAIHEWPEFNYFTGGFVLSKLNWKSEQFKEGLEWQWRTLDLCAQQKVNRYNPTFVPFMKYQTTVGKKRVCWNSWIAPHNFEGFFMNMGDMLVKQGDWRTAIKIYNNAKLSQTYTTWPYRNMLENRIQNAKQNVAYFRRDNGNSPDTRIMFNSGYGCMACHQRK